MHILSVTPELLTLLRKRRVFQTLSGANRLEVGSRICVPDVCRIEPFTEIVEGDVFPLVLGAFSYSTSRLAPWVRIGRYCSLAGGIVWMGADHPMDWASTSPALHKSNHAALRAFRADFGDYEAEAFPLPNMTVGIGHDVWIGDQAMIAPGVTIGDGAVIGARSLVLKDVPPYAVMVGQPARILRYRFPEELIARFLAARWWRFSPALLGGMPASDPERFLDAFEEKMARDAPAPMAPVLLTEKDLVAACTSAD